MSAIATETTVTESTALKVLMLLEEGRVSDAVGHFADKLSFSDHGIGLEFRDKDRLSEYFQKAREFYPDSYLETGTVFLAGNHVIVEWKRQTVVTEPYYGGINAQIRVSVPGVSIIRIEDGKISDWADYYDGLTSRRTALAAHFTDWLDL